MRKKLFIIKLRQKVVTRLLFFCNFSKIVYKFLSVWKLPFGLILNEEWATYDFRYISSDFTLI